MKKLSSRDKYFWLGSLIVIFLWILTDPDTGIITSLPFGASTVAMLVIAVKSVIYINILHLSRKMLLHYIDIEELYNIVKQSKDAQGAGLFTIGVALFSIAIAVTIYAATSQ